MEQPKVFSSVGAQLIHSCDLREEILWIRLSTEKQGHGREGPSLSP